MSQTQFTGFLPETLGNIGRGHARRRHRLRLHGLAPHGRAARRRRGRRSPSSRTLSSGTRPTAAWESFYRSKHELVFVFKQGTAAHTNTFGLGDTGRYRTNVWDYAGISSIGAGRSDELAMHPTVKPVALIADAIRDCSRRGEIVLDAFGGLRHDTDRRREDRPAAAADRVRSALLRHHHPALGGIHRQAREPRGDRRGVRGCRRSSGSRIDVEAAG